MFICNVKLGHKFIFKLGFVILFIIVMVIAGISIYKVFNGEHSNHEITFPDVYNISSNNYTNILKSVHDNLDEHIGQKIHFVGFVYRVYDFSNTQFVLGRNMKIGSNNETVVVGFLCDYKDANNFNDGVWVEITGSITKGNYHGDIPIIEIEEMKSCDKPSDEYVSPPDDMYIPTNALF